VRVRLLTLAGLLAATAPAVAECPTTPDDPVCKPWGALLVPTAIGVMYAPNRLGGTWYGAGVEAAMAWADNTPAAGPSHGKIRFDVAALGDTGGGAMAPGGAMAMYRAGAQVSFERNASRAWGIPYFDADVGGLWTSATGSRLFADGGVGVYVYARRGTIVDVEVDGLLPFSNPSELAGVRAQLALSYALW
jgi:hypothetical protein